MAENTTNEVSSVARTTRSNRFIGIAIISVIVLSICGTALLNKQLTFETSVQNEVRRNGGTIGLDEEGNVTSFDLKGLVIQPLFYSRLVTYPGLRAISFTDCDFSALSILKTRPVDSPSIVSVEVSNCTLKEGNCSWLSVPPALTMLKIANTDVDERLAESLQKCTNLSVADLSRTNIGDATIQAIADCPLRRVILRSTKVTDNGVERLMHPGNAIVALDISHTSVTSFTFLLRSPKLNEIYVDGFVIDQPSAVTLANMSNLHTLSMNECLIKSGAGAALSKHQKICFLSCAGCRFEEHELTSICSRPNLAAINLRKTLASDDIVVLLGRSSGASLYTVDLSETNIGHVSEETLSTFRSLRYVYVSEGHIDKSTEAAFTKCLPKCQVKKVPSENKNRVATS